MPFGQLFSKIGHGFEQLLFSSLTRRIVILNLTALVILLFWILYLNLFRDALTETKIESLRIQGRIIAGAIASSATIDTTSIFIDPEKLMELQAGESLTPHLDAPDNWDFPINPERVAPLLRRIIDPKTTRARIYDRDANILVDTRVLYSSGQVSSYGLPPIGNKQQGWFERLSHGFFSWVFGTPPPIELEQNSINGQTASEIANAMNGMTATAQRRNLQGELVVSVAVPIQRYRAVIGVLLLSTIGSDIDAVVQAERWRIFKIFSLVATVMLVLSLFLASTIANPLRKLAAASERVRHGHAKRVAIPDFSRRRDEIGHLSTSIRAMTEALYNRIEAIERFAADVSHELKNPLTSLRSAVETLPLAKTDSARNRLLDVIQHDVRRLDRLITDISDASRLDGELAREVADIVDMKKLLENIVAAAREVRRKKQAADIQLDIVPPGDNRQYLVSGHDLRLGQVISNLIENARSFIPIEGGEIRLHMARHDRHIRIIVEDNGPGIRVQNIDRIFERFYTDRPGVESFGQNSGLGLSISRQIIEAHEGSLTAENIEAADGKILGARFIIDLPALPQ